MKDLFRSQEDVLEHLAQTNALVVLDYDGTLAPLGGDCEMRPQTRALLAALARLYPVAVISGRRRADL